MNPFHTSTLIEERYRDFLRHEFRAHDPRLREDFEAAIQRDGVLLREPFISLASAFAEGDGLDVLGVRPKIAQSFERAAFRGHLPFRHQTEAFRRIRGGEPTVVATGTGSGKTEAFLLPILDHCDEHRGESGPKAILLYPMNALAVDQNNRIRSLCTGLDISFGVYTGATDRQGEGVTRPLDAPAEERCLRHEFEERPPDLFLTNYAMLEYLLLRGDGRRIFAKHHVRYIVLDEVHFYHGALGVDVAALLRRLRVALKDANPEAPEPIFIGTSATLQSEEGVDPRQGVAEFFSRLTGQRLTADGVIREHVVRPERPPGAHYTSPAPEISEEDLAHFDASTAERQEESVWRLLALLGAHDGEEPEAAFARIALPYDLLEWLRQPQSLSAVVERLSRVPERDGIDADRLRREIEATLLVGPCLPAASALRLRPRVHRFVRGLPPFWRCANADCGMLSIDERTVCAECGSRVLPLALCRSCGWDFFVTSEANGVDGFTRVTGWTQSYSTDDARYLFQAPLASERITAPVDVDEAPDEGEREDSEPEEAGREDVDGDEVPPLDSPDEDRRSGLEDVARRLEESFPERRLCLQCGCLHEEECCPACDAPPDRQRALRKKLGRGTTCPICRSFYGRGEQLAPLRLGNSPALTWIARTVMRALPDSDRRLLVFCDSRQDAAHQARYMKGAEKTLAVQRAIFSALNGAADGLDLDDLLDAIEPRLVDAGVLEPAKSKGARERNRKRALGALLIEFIYNARRRTSLERLGLVRVEYGGLADDLASSDFKNLCGEFGLPERAAAEGVRLILEAMRVNRACHLTGGTDDLLCTRLARFESGRAAAYALAQEYGITVSRNVGIPVVFAPPGDTGQRKPEAFESKASWSKNGRGALRSAWTHALGEAATVESLERVLDWLRGKRHIAWISVGRDAKHRIEGYSVLLSRHVELFACSTAARCDVCHRLVAGAADSDLCPELRCGGTLHVDGSAIAGNIDAELVSVESDITLKPAEHSAAIDQRQREDIEIEFQKSPPLVNVLACTPTLELGVNIGQLEAVAMRNVPPSPANYAQRAGRTGRRTRMGVVTAFARPVPHDGYFFDHPEEMIAGAIPAPRFNLRNREALARHVRSVALEAAKLTFDRNLFRYIGEEGDLNAAEVEALRRTIEDAAADARERAVAAFEGVDGIDRAWIEQRADETAAMVEDAIARRAEAVRKAAESMHQRDRVGATEREKRERESFRQLALTLRLGGERDQHAYLPRVLAEAGVIPGYAFPSDPGALALGYDPQMLYASRLQAQREYAPGQVVYARGGRWEVRGLALFRPDEASSRGLAEQAFMRCGGCGHANRPDANRCARPSCRAELEGRGETFVDAGTFQAFPNEVDPISEEERLLRRMDVRPHPQYDVGRQSYRLDGVGGGDVALELAHQEMVWWINHGRFAVGGAVNARVEPYRLCLRCGSSFPPPAQQAKSKRRRSRAVHELAASSVGPDSQVLDERERHHARPDVCGGEVREYAIGHGVKCDTLRLAVPVAMTEAGDVGLRWAWSVAYAIVQGAMREYDLDDDDIQPFVVTRKSEDGEAPVEILWTDTLVGGSGVLDELAMAFPRIAARALEHLAGHACETSCYRCLRTYRNARYHGLLDWRLAMPFLQNAAETTVSPGAPVAAMGDDQHGKDWQEARAEGCGSPLELRLLRAIRVARLPEPLKQYAVHRENRSLLTEADFAWPEQRVLVYADGLTYHNLLRNRIHDQRQTNELTNLGWSVLRFLGRQVYREEACCVEGIRNALARLGNTVAG